MSYFYIYIIYIYEKKIETDQSRGLRPNQVIHIFSLHSHHSFQSLNKKKYHMFLLQVKRTNFVFIFSLHFHVFLPYLFSFSASLHAQCKTSDHQPASGDHSLWPTWPQSKNPKPIFACTRQSSTPSASPFPLRHVSPSRDDSSFSLPNRMAI